MNTLNLRSDYKVSIKSYPFEKEIIEQLRDGSNDLWPVVYFIESDTIKEAYVGESTTVYKRMTNHIANPERENLSNVHIMYSKSFNKSAILDIESRLIKYIGADGAYELQNANGGLIEHNYYQQDNYENLFKQIWGKLYRKKLVKNDINKIYNSDLFKFSPYKALTNDQFDSVLKILEEIEKKTKSPIIVTGGAGTGKTVLATFIIKLFKNKIGEDEESLDKDFQNILDSIENISINFPKIEIGFVIPQQSLRATIKNVFKYVKGLSPNMVISARDVTKKEYDIVFVDEAHRLRRRKNLPGGYAYTAFDNISKKLGLNPSTCDELDWIIKCSKQQVLFYDPLQSIKPTDIKPGKISLLINKKNKIELKSQLRVLGGNDYIDYIDNILSVKKPKKIFEWGNYELKLYKEFAPFMKQIKSMNKKHDLCRMIGGYSWKWISKKDPSKFDIEIEGTRLRWNVAEVDWINSPNSIDEVGCIHTTQGYDLNFAGVIFGREIDYNPTTNQIEIDKKLYFDQTGRNGIEDYELKEYLINIYKTIMYRGIRGTYVYAYNKNFQDYLSNFMKNK
jgi:DUF2075 family protein